MTHLRILQHGIACKPDNPCVHSGVKTVTWERLDDVDCEGCRASIHWEAAERVAMERAHHQHDLISKLVQKTGQERITGPLAPDAKLTEDMSNAEKLRAMTDAMTPEEKVEAVARWNDLSRDTCPSCGGSIKHEEHSEDCLGPDPDKWQLTDEQVRAELMVLGTDPDAAAKRLRERLDKLVAKHRDG